MDFGDKLWQVMQYVFNVLSAVVSAGLALIIYRYKRKEKRLDDIETDVDTLKQELIVMRLRQDETKEDIREIKEVIKEIKIDIRELLFRKNGKGN